MCTLHEQVMSRRNLGILLGGAAALAAMPAWAAGHAEALVLTCMDYRLRDNVVAFCNGAGLKDNYDEVVLAGAALAAVSPKFPNSNRAFWDHVGFAKQLHSIHKVVVIDHRDCGAYRLALGAAPDIARDAETALHKTQMQMLKAQVAQKDPELGAEFYLMALDGKTERVL